MALAQLENIAGWALELTCNGAPDEAMKPTVGVLVGLLWSGAESASAEGAACALRSLANRGTFGDAIREAGGARALLKLIGARDEIDSTDSEKLVATGFLRMGPWEQTGMSVFRITRQQWLDEQLSA